MFESWAGAGNLLGLCDELNNDEDKVVNPPYQEHFALLVRSNAKINITQNFKKFFLEQDKIK